MRNYCDIETIPDQDPDAFEKYLDAVEPPGNYKKQETIDNWLLENAEAIALENFQKTGLTGLRGEICSIAFAINDREILQVGRTASGNERDLLLEFWEELAAEVEAELSGSNSDRAKAPFVKLQWIGHNIIDFDLRFLHQRSIVNGIKPAYFLPTEARHGSDYVFDTMKEWAGWRGYVKQDELCEAFGIVVPDGMVPISAVELDGSMVWPLFQKGEFDTIAEYNKLDVWKVREIHRRMTYA